MSKVWYITGGSKGLGLTLAQHLIGNGHQVAVTSRSTKSLTEAMRQWEDSAFLPLEVDLTDPESVSASIKATIQHFGKLDVVINNAGYGIGGAIEELEWEDVRGALDINLQAVLHTMRAVMPHFRENRSGHVINIASIAGIAGTSGWSVYSAAKAAVIALSQSVAQEVAPFNVFVTAVAPGAFRTEFLSQESLSIGQTRIPDYAKMHENLDRYQRMGGSQAGDPQKAAEVIAQLGQNANPPKLLFLGSDAYQRAKVAYTDALDELEAFKQTTTSTDF